VARYVKREHTLDAVSPLATVARGYAIIEQADGSPVRSVHQVQPGEQVSARLHDGQLQLRVEACPPP